VGTGHILLLEQLVITFVFIYLYLLFKNLCAAA